MSLSRPIGTDERCCFVCGWSSTNPDMPGALFKPQVHLFVQCHRFGGQMMRRQEVCGVFCARDEWPGFTPLPEEHP